MGEWVDRQVILDEMERTRREFHRLVEGASTDELSNPSHGTRWTNEQLLFHMLFGFMVVRALLILVRMFGHLPNAASLAFSRILNFATVPFHFVNYIGSCGAALVFNRRRMGAKFDRTMDADRKSVV